MQSGTLHVPGHAPLPGADAAVDVPFVMVGDATFPLKTYLRRPYPGHNLTHRKGILNTGFLGQEWLLKMPLAFCRPNGGLTCIPKMWTQLLSLPK